jgi:hypothetical protein
MYMSPRNLYFLFVTILTSYKRSSSVSSILASVVMGKLANKTVQARSTLRMLMSIVSMNKKRSILSTYIIQVRHRPGQQVKHPIECVTRFDDLPDEILLIICRYLNPAHVLQAFFNYNNRMFSCISDYRQNINLTQCSFTDVQYFLRLITNEHLRPSTLTISNVRMPTEVKNFANACHSSAKFHPNYVRHLSILECTFLDIQDIQSYVGKFTSLQSLRIVESATSDGNHFSVRYAPTDMLRYLMFNLAFNTLIELQLSSNAGIVLDKQLYPNEHLKRLIISLQKIDDLFILFDGLAPNLIVLNVTVCLSDVCKRSLVPRASSHRFMSHLIEFRLTTNENVTMCFDHLRGIVMPLNQLEKFTLDVKQWISNDQPFVNGNQIDMLIRQCMPRLRHFDCFIQTINDIDMQVNYPISQLMNTIHRNFLDFHHA